jgi:hypothetical protein
MTTTKRFIICAFCVITFLSSLAAQEKKEARPAKVYNIENCVAEFSIDKAIPTKAGYQFWFFDSTFVADGRTFKLSVVRPNSTTHPPHKHNNDEFISFLREPQILPGRQNTGTETYTTFYCPPGQCTA